MSERKEKKIHEKREASWDDVKVFRILIFQDVILLVKKWNQIEKDSFDPHPFCKLFLPLSTWIVFQIQSAGLTQFPVDIEFTDFNVLSIKYQLRHLIYLHKH